MKLILVIVAIIVVAFIFLVRRGRTTAATAPGAAEATRKLSDTSKFHAVSLKAGSDACAEARTIEGKRYLANGAPRLPLTSCDVSDCRCRFVHHADRRGGDDRRTPYPSPIGLDKRTYEQDQRKDSDRRRNPPNDF